PGGIKPFERRPQIPIHEEASTGGSPQMRMRCAAPEIRMLVRFGQHDRHLEQVLIRVKSRLGERVVDGDARFSLVSDHHSPDAAPLHLRQARQIGVQRQLKLASPDALGQVPWQVVPLVLVRVHLETDPDAELEPLSLRRKEALLHGLQLSAKRIEPRDLFSIGINDGRAVVRVAGIAHAVRGVSIPAQASRCSLFHLHELGTGIPADGMTGSGGVHRTHGSGSGHLRCERKQPAASSAGDDRGLRFEDIEFAGPHVYTGRPDNPASLSRPFREQARHDGPVVHPDAETLHFVEEALLQVEAPDPQDVAVPIVVAKHQLRLVVPEVRALELIVQISNLHAHLLALEQRLPTFRACDVARNSVGVAVGALHDGHGVVQGRYLRARVLAGAVPVVNACASRAAALQMTRFDDDDFGTLPGGADRGVTSCYAPTYDEDVSGYLTLLVVTYGIRPLRQGPMLLNEFTPGRHGRSPPPSN